VSQEAVDYLARRATENELRIGLKIALRHRREPKWREVARIYCKALQQRRGCR
jgi:hypothetical protein